MIKKRSLIISLIFLSLALSYSYNNLHLKKFMKYNHTPYKKGVNARLDLSGAVIDNYQFYGTYYNMNFRGAKITNGFLLGTEFVGCDFSNCLLKKMKVGSLRIYRKRLHIKNSTFLNAEIIDLRDLSGSKFVNVDFSKVKFLNTSLVESFIINIKFRGAKMIESWFTGYLYNCDFSQAHMEGGSVGGNMNVYDYVRKEIRDTKYSIGERLVFRGAKITATHFFSIRNSDFRSTLIRQAEFSKKFTNINFDNSKLLKCKFNKIFKGINLSFRNANLSGSIFEKGSSITNANFTNANLTDVDFAGATFKNVIFKNADMKGAKIERKWYNYIKRQGVRNFDKIVWVG